MDISKETVIGAVVGVIVAIISMLIDSSKPMWRLSRHWRYASSLSR